MIQEEINNAIKALLEDDRIDLAEMLEDYISTMVRFLISTT